MTTTGALRAVGIAIALVALTAPTSSIARVRLDPAFGGRGFATTPIRGASALAYGATVLPGGKAVIVGQETSRSGTGQVVVARYRRDGRLDRGFGSRGIFRTALPRKDGPFIATAVARQRATGRLVVAGGYGQGSMLAFRLTGDGRLDRGFGRGRSGLTRVRAGGIAQSIAIQRDGGILLGGSDANVNGRPMLVARLRRGGALDRSFAAGGVARSIFWNPDLAASAGITGLAVAADGGIVGSGHLDYIGSDGHGSAGVFRLDANGAPDPGFGSGGHVEVAFTESGGTFAQWFPCAMTVDSLGRITVTGDGSLASTASLLTARVTSSGAMDTGFGGAGDGKAVAPGLRGDDDTTCGAAVGLSGRLTVGVGSALAQLGPDGTANAAFAPNGIFGIRRPRNVTVNAVAAAGSRRIVVAGGAGRNIYVARYLLR
jgi:uncharacterized delta-60 repeat protein